MARGRSEETNLAEEERQTERWMGPTLPGQPPTPTAPHAPRPPAPMHAGGGSAPSKRHASAPARTASSRLNGGSSTPPAPPLAAVAALVRPPHLLGQRLFVLADVALPGGDVLVLAHPDLLGHLWFWGSVGG
jgi:hypothetical protein